MNVIAKDFATKAVVAVVAAAMFLSIAAPAKAQTAEELQAMINNLLAQIAALQAGGSTTGTGTATGFQFTRDLRQGSTGADVLELQRFLNRDADTRVAATGAGSPGMETSFFGPATAAAVSKFQVKYRADILTPAGLVNPTGFFGPSSRAKANALNSTTDGGTTPTDGGTTPTDPDNGGALQGGEGDLDVEIMTDGTVGIDLGKADTPIELTVEAIDSDIAINRVDVEFSHRPWLYFKEVNLLVDGREVESFTRSNDFTRSGDNFRARFSGLNVVVREGSTAEIAIEVVVLDALAGNRFNDQPIAVTVPRDGIRFTDAAGITSTTISNDVKAQVTFGDAFADGRVRLNVADNSPENATIVLSETSNTTGVTLAIIEAEARGDDMRVTDIEVDLVVTGTTTATINDTVRRVGLFDGNRQIGRGYVTPSSTSTTEAVAKFTRVNYDLDKDDILDLSIRADFNRGDATGMADTIKVTEVRFVTENSNYVTATEKLPINEVHRLVTSGLVPTNERVNVSRNANTTNVSFTFDVTAYEEDAFISAVTATAVNQAFTLTGGTSTMTVAPEISVSGVTRSNNAFRIQRGQTRTVTVSYEFVNTSTTAPTFVTGGLTQVRYGKTAAAANNSGVYTVYTIPGNGFEVPANTAVSARTSSN